MQRALQKPEESIRRPHLINDAWLLSETNNDQREILAELTPDNLAETINAICSELRQIIGSNRWSDLPVKTLADIKDELDTGTGLTIWTAGEDITKGQVVYISSRNTVKIAHANDLSHTNVIGIANESAVMGAQFKVAHSNRELSGFSGLESGRRYFLQTNGNIGTVFPNTSGSFVQRCGFAKNETTLLISLGEPKVKP